ncbi:MAG: mandelate racemase/muconate lactonizing enzyme family protein [Actinomycetales bacterium]|nr:mandelate racemase/muconate lactonizing enzyme family protein [Actinomycetales bacterium]
MSAAMSPEERTANAREAGRIIAISTYRWQAQPNCLWVEIETASGAVGLGETFYQAAAVESIIHEMVAPLLLGTSAESRNAHAWNLFACANFCGYAGSEMRAFSAIDIALWDIAGLLLDRPIHALLGGAVRDSIGIYSSCADAGGYQDSTRSWDDPAGLARELLDSGIKAMKIWPFDRFAPQIEAAFVTGPAGWSAMGPPGSYLSARHLEEGISRISQIRQAVGSEIEIIIEGHSRWDVNCALRILHALEPYDIMWVEDIIQPDSVGDLRRLAQESRVPQAVSERLFTRYAYRDVLEANAARIIMLDVAWTGGITESSRICDLADTYHLPVAPHDCTGPVTALANLHLCAAKTNIITTETVRGFVDGYYGEVLDTPLPIRNGVAVFPERPGLGAALSPDFKARPDVQVRRSVA